MKLFVDSANPKEIKELWEIGIIDGVTTNPTLATKAGVDYQEAVEKILKSVDGDISLEVLATDIVGMTKEARALSKLNKNIVVKLPTTEEGIQALKILKTEGIRVNMTLIFNANQALIAAKLGAYCISPFVGRIDDTGESGIEIVEEIKQIYENYKFETQILFASVRSPLHVKQAALIGVDIATCPYDVIKKLYTHPKTTEGLEKFLKDFKDSKQKPLV